MCALFQYVDPPSTPSPEGLVYPRITDVTVSYTDPVNMTTVTACDDLSGDDSSCSFYISLTDDENRPMIDVSVEVTNEGGSNVSQRTFECESIVTTTEFSSCCLVYLCACAWSVSRCVCLCTRLHAHRWIQTKHGEKDEYHRS